MAKTLKVLDNYSKLPYYMIVMATKVLENARKNKADEFYTQLADIDMEMQHYKDHFKNKVVFCNCDDPFESNFFKFFAINFKTLALKQLIATCYIGSPIANKELTLFDFEIKENKTTKQPHKIVINEALDENKDGMFDLQDVVTSLTKNKNNTLTRLNGDGDFRSAECIEVLKQADIVVTNPPFSLFREFIAQLIEYKKQFLIIGNMNAISYKEIFPLIKNNLVWLGVAFGRDFKGFIVPNIYPLSGTETRVDKNGNRIVSTNNTIWLTNIDHGKRHQPIQLLTMEKNLKLNKHKKIKDKSGYATYDNCNAIEVPYSDAIPCDYTGVMGVPISFLHKYCPEQFEIVGFRKGDDGRDLSINGRCPYFRILIKNKGGIKNE